MKTNKIKGSRTDEVQDIIERMPSVFGNWVTAIVVFIFVAMISLGYLVKYPDVVTGAIVINPNVSPVKLMAGATGKIIVLTKPKQKVGTGDILAYIENSTNISDVKKIKIILSSIRPGEKMLKHPSLKFSDIVLTGQLALKYARLVNTFQLLYDLQNDNYYENQEKQLSDIVKQDEDIMTTENEQLKLSLHNLQLISKFQKRDSILYKQNAESESDMDKSEMNYINVAQNYRSSQKDVINTNQQIYETKHKIEQLEIEKDEKERQYLIDFQSAYSDLDGNVKDWEEKYCFLSPYEGTVEFLEFWQNKQFIQAGQEAFTIIPSQKAIYGRMMLPTVGSGKVKVGQEVIVKLDSYPYMEFGSVKGNVSSISLTTNVLKDGTQAATSQYLITVNLPEQLQTNYGSSLDFKLELKGTADVITNDRRLIERLFDNMRYSLKN